MLERTLESMDRTDKHFSEIREELLLIQTTLGNEDARSELERMLRERYSNLNYADLVRTVHKHFEAAPRVSDYEDMDNWRVARAAWEETGNGVAWNIALDVLNRYCR